MQMKKIETLRNICCGRTNAFFALRYSAVEKTLEKTTFEEK